MPDFPGISEKSIGTNHGSIFFRSLRASHCGRFLSLPKSAHEPWLSRAHRANLIIGSSMASELATTASDMPSCHALNSHHRASAI